MKANQIWLPLDTYCTVLRATDGGNITIKEAGGDNRGDTHLVRTENLRAYTIDDATIRNEKIRSSQIHPSVVLKMPLSKKRNTDDLQYNDRKKAKVERPFVICFYSYFA